MSDVALLTLLFIFEQTPHIVHTPLRNYLLVTGNWTPDVLLGKSFSLRAIK